MAELAAPVGIEFQSRIASGKYESVQTVAFWFLELVFRTSQSCGVGAVSSVAGLTSASPLS